MVVKNRFDFIVPAAAALVFALLGVAGVTDRIEQRVYDLFLHVKPTIKEDPSILLLDIDDQGISKVGVWPWSRDIMANGLILMREFGAAYAVFDIEYLEKSPRGVDSFTLRQDVPDAFNQEFAQLTSNIQQLFDAIRTGSIPLSDAGKYVSDLEGLTEQGKAKLLATVQSVERDNDVFLGQAARFFGSAFLTVNTLLPSDESAPKDMEQYALENLAYKNVVVKADPTQKGTSLNPAILPIIKGARGAGFPNVVVDSDGVRRRINLLMSYKGEYFASLAFRPLLDLLGDPQITLTRGGLLLKAADVPGKGKRDISIPLASGGKFLINWSHKKFLKSFDHLAYYELVYHGETESDLLFNLRLMNQSGYLAYAGGETGLLETYSFADTLKKEMLSGGDLSRMDDYVKTRQVFFDAVGKFLSGGAEKAILADVDKVLSGKRLSAEERKNVEEVKAQVPGTFSGTRGIYDNLMKTRSILAKNLPGRFCVIGNIATSTTDIGVNPFDSEYMNVGTHASVVNTILQGQFLDELPWWYGVALSVIFAFAVTFALLNLSPLRSIIVGTTAVVALVGLFIAFFLLTGIYIDTFTPVISVLLTFMALTVIKFLRTERDRSFLRSAFAHYLSTDVINDLLSNPDKLVLGGESKVLTAMFTDIKGFSTISEVLNPSELVHLLNLYLTEMSDIILKLKGTIDKYEGDAIISFFGAPLELADHAQRACMAAVWMKRAEIALNERFLNEKLAPSSLHTRIGINMGEMVVGNMGTLQKMDYTIMGSSVNLASRLEGVNKQYGTWIMMSDAVEAAGGSGFLTRKLDRVRVVGINTPVRLYELIDEKNVAPRNIVEAVGIFHEGLEAFEAKEWDKAAESFGAVLRLLPEDEPAKRYLKLCEDFKSKPPAEGWDGVFNLTQK